MSCATSVVSEDPALFYSYPHSPKRRHLSFEGEFSFPSVKRTGEPVCCSETCAKGFRWKPSVLNPCIWLAAGQPAWEAFHRSETPWLPPVLRLKSSHVILNAGCKFFSNYVSHFSWIWQKEINPLSQYQSPPLIICSRCQFCLMLPKWKTDTF